MQKKIEKKSLATLAQPQSIEVSELPNGRRRRRVQLNFLDKSLTEQQYKEDCDLQNILDRYTRTGELPNSRNEGQYLDLAGMPSYSEALNFVRQSQEQFMELPAKLRERFKNDPQAFLAFIDDPKNLPEMVKLGLATAQEALKEPVSSPVSKEKQEPTVPVPAVGEGPKT